MSENPSTQEIQDNLAGSVIDLRAWDKAAARALEGDMTATPPPTTR